MHLEEVKGYLSGPASVTRNGDDWSWSMHSNFPCLHAATDHGMAGSPPAVQISITVVEVASDKGHA